MNAANERAVSAFLDRRIAFLDIPNVVAETLERMDRTGAVNAADGDAVECARNTDAEARRVADEVVTGFCAA
jgi:1-deoxy-D-xylulose-5-phosphate reductoisomerase